MKSLLRRRLLLAACLRGRREPGGRLGFRVPCLVMGGRARHGHVSHTQYSHASIVATICRTFGPPALDRADRAANALFDCFEPG